MSELFCAIDIGGTKIHIGIMNKVGKILGDTKIATKVAEGPKNALDRVHTSIKNVMMNIGISKENIKGIGIGSPGPLDSQKGVILHSSNLGNWKNVEVKKYFSQIFKDIPIQMANDCNAAVLGEYLYGSGKGTKNFVYITVSTGIGGGAIIDGKLQTGSNDNAFEIGHMIIQMNGRLCNCGNYGCWEAYGSGTALEKMATEKINEGQKSLIQSLNKGDRIQAKSIFKAAKQKDPLALELIKKEGYYLGIGLYNVIAAYNAEKISIGGGVSNGLDLFYDEMIHTIEGMSISASIQACKIQKATEKNCALLGAGALAFFKHQ